MFIDYEVAENCENPDSYGMICVKCGKCGRKFNGQVLLSEKANPERPSKRLDKKAGGKN